MAFFDGARLGNDRFAGWNAPSWSISAEWFAYLLFPAVAAGTLALPRRAALPLSFAMLLLAAFVFHLDGWAIEGAVVGPPALMRVASEFICGVLLYRAVRLDSAELSPGTRRRIGVRRSIRILLRRIRFGKRFCIDFLPRRYHRRRLRSGRGGTSCVRLSPGGLAWRNLLFDLPRALSDISAAAARSRTYLWVLTGELRRSSDRHVRRKRGRGGRRGFAVVLFG